MGSLCRPQTVGKRWMERWVGSCGQNCKTGSRGSCCQLSWGGRELDRFGVDRSSAASQPQVSLLLGAAQHEGRQLPALLLQLQAGRAGTVVVLSSACMHQDSCIITGRAAPPQQLVE